MKTSIKPTVGNWTSEEGFFNREFERKDLADKLRAGANLSLVAPRRVGKTSLLRAVQRDLDKEFACLFVDLEAATSAEQAVREIAEVAARHQSLKTKVTTFLGRFQASASVATPVGDVSLALRDALQIDWQRRGHQLIEGLVADNTGVVLFLDEVPILVRTLLRQPTAPGERGPADVFLSWLRKVTQEHRGALRVVMTGSIGLAPMVARANLSATLNAFEHQTLNPWSRETTVAALLALAADTRTPLTPQAPTPWPSCSASACRTTSSSSSSTSPRTSASTASTPSAPTRPQRCGPTASWPTTPTSPTGSSASSARSTTATPQSPATCSPPPRSTSR
jgi:hypothetical protein